MTLGHLTEIRRPSMAEIEADDATRAAKTARRVPCFNSFISSICVSYAECGPSFLFSETYLSGRTAGHKNKMTNTQHAGWIERIGPALVKVRAAATSPEGFWRSDSQRRGQNRRFSLQVRWLESDRDVLLPLTAEGGLGSPFQEGAAPSITPPVAIRTTAVIGRQKPRFERLG
jgi:hypothetical protein